MSISKIKIIFIIIPIFSKCSIKATAQVFLILLK